MAIVTDGTPTAVKHEIATCGYYGCLGANNQSTNTGGGYYKEPKGKPTYVWVAIHSTNPQTSNMPMFYSLKVYLKGVNSLAESYLARLEIYGLHQCEKQYGAGTCSVIDSAYGGRSSYVAVASTAKKGATAKFAMGTGWYHDSKAQAEQQAIQNCQYYAQQNSYNPNDCRVIYSSSFASVGNQIPDKKSHSLHSAEITQDPRLPCFALIDADRPACEQRRQNR